MWAFGPGPRCTHVLNSAGFEVEAEIFAQVVKKGLRISEISVPSTSGASFSSRGELLDGALVKNTLMDSVSRVAGRKTSFAPTLRTGSGS